MLAYGLVHPLVDSTHVHTASRGGPDCICAGAVLPSKVMRSLPRNVILRMFLLTIGLSGAGMALSQRSEKLEFPDIVDLLALKEGNSVADVGAGGGTWTMLLSKHAGPKGRVYATDVKAPQVEGLRAIASQSDYSNVTAILGSEDDTRLPEACCDAILLRLVYHAFDKPDKMRASLHRALRPGGRILIIDFRPDAKALVEQMESSGFQAKKTIDRWQGQEGVYAVLLVRN